MAKGKGSIQGWITKNGVHIPIYGTYTVREGHEPTAKGAKFKGKKKKKENWNVEHVRNDIFQSNTSVKEQADYIDYLHKKGKINDEEKATLSKELADRHKNKISKDVGAVTSSDSKAAFEDETPGKTAQREKDAEHRAEVAKSNHENMLAVKERIREKEAMEERKAKYANRDWNKDVDDAKRYGYSEQSETGKKPVTKAESEHYDTRLNNIRERMRSGEITTEQAKDEAFEYEKSQRGNKQWDDRDRNRMESKVYDIFKEADESTKAGQTSSTPVHPDQRKFASKKAYEKALAEYEGREYVEPTRKATSQPKETAPDTYRMNDMNWDHLKEVDDDYLKSEYKRLNNSKLKAYETDMTHDTRLAMRDELKRRGYSDQDPTTGRIYGPKKESSSRTPKLVAPTEEMKRELGIDKDYGTHNLSAAKETMKRYKTESPLYAEDKVRRYAKAAQAEKAKAQSIADAISSATGIANSGSIQNMSPSGLKSAYAEATGARKTKLANELRKRGYQLTGGRWTKKKS